LKISFTSFTKAVDWISKRAKNEDSNHWSGSICGKNSGDPI